MTETQKKTVGLAIASLVLGCLFIIPLLGLLCSLLAIIFGIIALVSISKDKEHLKGKGLAISGIVLGVFGIIIIPIIMLLAAIAIPNLLRAKISANDALAQSTLRTLSVASETYATVNQGKYPMFMSDLTNANPPYISMNYCGMELSGYQYACELGSEGYVFAATPMTKGTTGTKEWIIQTGGEVFER